MKAMIFDRYGGPEVLHEAEVPMPAAGPGQVRVRVKAVGFNPLDAKIRSGVMQAIRPMTLPALLGMEMAGIVDQVGEGVTGLAVGDDVLGPSDSGAYAQYALAGTLARKPAAMSWETAAALPVAGGTAQRVLDLLKVSAGETLLIHGAAGAVGTVAVQLAVRRGATVIGTASPANLDYLRDLGAIPLEYGDGLVERVRALAPRGIDAVFDVAGKGALPASIELRGGTSRIITIADMGAQALGIPFSAGSPEMRSAAALANLARLVVDGTLRLTVSATYPLEQAAEAHRLTEAGHARGKIVLLVD